MAPGLETAGAVISTHARRAVPGASGPVEVIAAPTVEQSAAPPSARIATDHPAGSAGGVTPAAFVAANVAARLNESATRPVLVIQARKRVVVGVAAASATEFVRMIVMPVAPRPSAAVAVPAGGAARSLVMSVVLATTADSVSMTSSDTAGLKTDVARIV